MKKQIVIIGAGQLGSRHLQSLSELEGDKYFISVYDTQQDSLDLSKERYNQVRKENSPCVRYRTAIEQHEQEIFVCIIATNSIVRRAVIENLLKSVEVNFLILEKFLFPQEEDYVAIENIISQKGVKVFVNTPRRMYPFYQELKRQLKPPIFFNVTGSDWGLACNAIHFVDLFTMLTGSDTFDNVSSALYREVSESKRAGYMEFNGSIRLDSFKFGKCTITCFKGGDVVPTITISDTSQILKIREQGAAYIEKTIKSNTHEVLVERKEIIVPFQSQLTSKVIEQLFQENTCELPTYKTSMNQHLVLLKLFLKHYSSITSKHQTLCPIT